MASPAVTLSPWQHVPSAAHPRPAATIRTAIGALPNSLHASRQKLFDAAFPGIGAVKAAPAISSRPSVKD